MKKSFLFSCFALLLIIVHGQSRIFPVIKNYGGVFDVPNAIDKPDSTLQYNIIAEAGSKIEHPDSVFQPFETISRMYNLHIYGGVKPKNLHIEIVFYFESIFVVLNNEAYKKKYGVNNPNLDVIEQLKKAGVKLYACGQSATGFGIDRSTINPNFDVVFSRLTTVTTRQIKGYAYFRL
jgi:intracellular sulfur oxidation DsrE/DsrF family protein